MDEELNDFLTSFGIDPGTVNQDPPPVDDPPNDTPPVDNPPNDPPAGDPNLDQPPNNEPPAGDEPPAQPPVDRASQAFAAMRVENSTLKNTLLNVAKVLGIEGSNDMNVLAEQIKAKSLEAQAAQQKVPLEMLQDLERLKGLEGQFTAQQRQQKAVLGFQKLATDFKLGNEEIMAFAQELLNEGRNPYEQDIDVAQEYQNRNFTKLIEAAKAEGIRQEQERAAKAGTSGSEPGANNGGAPGAGEQINTIAGLDAYFKSINM